MADTQLPLLGVILCCTSIPPEQRSNLASIAQQMGAVNKLDLTSDVTHLVVGDTDTPKYKFVARERPDVKCVRASWLEAVRASWLEGGETNVEAIEVEHKLPTFIGLKICVTGFEDLVYRKQLEDLIIDNGGEYRGNLTKDITHLIAKEPSGAKYSYAGQWNIKIVAVEWLEQSLERGMILDESLYSLALPALQRGRNAWVRRTTSRTSLGKRSREDELGAQNTRKLRRTASARLSSQNVGLWTDIVGMESRSEAQIMNQWDDEEKSLENLEHKGRASGTGGKAHEELKMVNAEIEPRTSSELVTVNSAQREGIFRGKIFLLQGFDEKKTSILQEHSCSHGANVVTDVADLPTLRDIISPNKLYHVVPHDLRNNGIHESRVAPQISSIVTELYIERCLYKKKFEDPSASVINTPFPSFPIKGFERLSINSTSFQGIDLLHVSKAVKLMGATYEEFFTPTVSVLVCNAVTPGHEKLLHAQLWGIPAVTADWLWDCIRKVDFIPFGSYLTQPVRDPKQSSADVETAKVHDKSTRAQRDDRPLGTTRTTTSKPTTKHSSPQESFKDVAKETPYQSEPSKLSKHASLKASLKSYQEMLAQADDQPVYLDDETLRPISKDAENSSSNTLNAPSTSAPLREITPNSSPPKPSISPTKGSFPNKSKPQPQPQRNSIDDSSLGPAISSLLAHHQRTNTSTNPPASNSSSQPRIGRRHRQLLGRAPSNLSSHSINLSRASSVDTMNTDGLGTPLELSSNNKSKPGNSKTKIDFPNFYIANQNDDPDREEPPLQMTQLGYEDPDVAAWRERVAIKMGGGKVRGTTPGRKSVRPRDEGGGVGGLGIAKRTRLASGR